MLQILAKSPLFEAPRRVVWKLIIKALATKNMTVAPATDQGQRGEAYSLIKRVIAERDMLLSEQEAYQVLSSAKHALKVSGQMAEVGVYRGGSAKLIAEVKGRKKLHLFDMFEAGLPETSSNDQLFQAGQYKSSKREVEDYLAKYDGLHVYPGLFPGTADSIQEEKFCFVHLDTDTFQSVSAGLAFFYPRMSAGGLILIHDYAWAQGVRDAVDGFLSDKAEPLIELAGSYCGLAKLR